MILYADKDGHDLGELKTNLENFQEIMMLVGPEGGFSEREFSQLKESDALPAVLGPNILRVETAAIALLSTVNQCFTR